LTLDDLADVRAVCQAVEAFEVTDEDMSDRTWKHAFATVSWILKQISVQLTAARARAVSHSVPRFRQGHVGGNITKDAVEQERAESSFFHVRRPAVDMSKFSIILEAHAGRIS